jgi:hypothetical protein
MFKIVFILGTETLCPYIHDCCYLQHRTLKYILWLTITYTKHNRLGYVYLKEVHVFS